MANEKLSKPNNKSKEQAAPEEKPISPEAEIVAANQPKTETAPQETAPPEPQKIVKTVKAKTTETAKTGVKKPVPTQIGKEVKPRDTSRFLIITGLSLAGLFVLFVILMVLMIAGGGGQSAILRAFGLDESGIKYFLLTIINLSFGFLALIFFVLTVIGVFRLLFAKKSDKEARTKGVRMTMVGVLPLVFVMFIWMFLFNFINRIVVSAERVKAEITVIEPADLTNLAAPIEITFSSENVVKSLRNSGFSVTGGKWDFNGDGVFETEITTSHQMSYLYNNKGDYNVGLEINVIGEETPRRYYFPFTIQEALFSANPATGTAPLKVSFDASNIIPKGTKLQSVDWDFNGDGTYDTSSKDATRATYTFEQVGKYKVHLRVVDVNNLVQNFYRDIDVTASTEPLLLADIEATPGLTGTIPLQINFDGGKSSSLKGAIVNYEWNFGDGSPTQKGRTVSHVYNNPGTYNVNLTITEDSGKNATSTVVIEAKEISSAPVASISTTPPTDTTGKLTGETPLKVAFDASKSTDPDNDIVEYMWDFGIPGAGQSGQKVEYTFDEADAYTVTLTVKDSQNNSNTATVSVEVAAPGVKAVINATPEEGTAPLIVNFDGSGSSSSSGNIVSYEWDFGDGSPKSITGAQISHKYTDIGTYEVTLKVTSNQNETGETKKTIYVREIPLKACFTPSRRSGDAPLAVTFDSKCSTGPVSKYSWDFGDGETSTDRKPSHTFENTGTYNVKLEVADDKNNVNTFSDVIVVLGTLQ